jgi:hypothetical protein
VGLGRGFINGKDKLRLPQDTIQKILRHALYAFAVLYHTQGGLLR